MRQDNGGGQFLATVTGEARVRLTLANRDEILSGCIESRLWQSQSPRRRGARRGALLFLHRTQNPARTQYREEIKLVRDMLGEGVPACGFYGYGEISPNNGDSRRTSDTTKTV